MTAKTTRYITAVFGAVIIISMILLLLPPAQKSFAQSCSINLILNEVITLTPPTDLNVVGQQHSISAAAAAPAPTPPAGTLVEFQVTGANSASGNVPIAADGTATFTYIGSNVGLDTITATYNWEEPCSGDDVFIVEHHGEGAATKEWDMFVIPESPIGIIALMASSLAALGGFMFWKRRSSSSDGMIGLGI